MEHANDIQMKSPVMQRFSARTLDEATWTCERYLDQEGNERGGCGVIPGKAITFTGSVRYVKNPCPCKIAEVEKKQYEARRQQWAQWQRARTFSWLGERWDDRALLDKTFDNFDKRTQPHAFQDVQSFILDMRGCLVLHGTYGTGKTHLLAALCNEIRQLGKGSLFVTAPDLFAAIQSRIATNQDYSELISAASSTALLVIDDIDKAKFTEFKEDIYIQIVNRRVNAGRPIAISTNRLDDLEKYVGGAVCSRLKVGQIDSPMLGLDYREVLEVGYGA